MLRIAWLVALAACNGSPTSSPVTNENGKAQPPQSEQHVVLAVNAHVSILKTAGSFAEYRDVMESARMLDPVVSAAAPFAYAELRSTLTPTRPPNAVMVKGVDPEQVAKILDLERYITSGSIRALAEPGDVPSILIGRDLMKALHAYNGATLTLTLVSDRSSPPREFAFRIGGVFDTGNADYDGHMVFASLPVVQDVLGRGDVVSGVDLRLTDATRAPEIARRLNEVLGGPPYALMDWHQLNQALLAKPR
jgi:lipoprotein-releasing system permease protein